MKFIPVAILVCLFFSCSTPVTLFTKRSDHEKYNDNLRNAGLAETALYKAWQQQAERSIASPVIIELPYSETGYFSAKEPLATGYKFSVKRGQNVTVTITKPGSGFAKIFCDLFTQNSGESKYNASIDSTSNTLTYEAEGNDTLLLRLQPELLRSANYTLTIMATASLAFPVSHTGKKYNIGSFWGASRDAGARKHEGIDIFGAFRTPVVAAANGTVTRVGENTLGGKVIFMRPEGKSYSLYYAHLDSQIAHEGQRVVVGDTLGLMGNTGNARTTPTHLHFGIYAFGGAVDPLPFVNPEKKDAPPVTASVKNIGLVMRNKSVTKLYKDDGNNNDSTLQANSWLYVQSAEANQYKVMLADGSSGFIKSSVAENTDKNFRSLTISSSDTLFESPLTASPFVTVFSGGKELEVKAAYKDFYYVEAAGLTGWIKK